MTDAPNNEPSSWVKYMPRWLRALIATAAGLSLFCAYFPREVVDGAIRLIQSPVGAILLYGCSIVATGFAVYKVVCKLVESRISTLTDQVRECREHHRHCEVKQRQLTSAVLDFIHGDTENAIATVKKLLTE